MKEIFYCVSRIVKNFPFIFCYDSIEKVNEKRFIFESFLLNFCKLNNILSIISKSLSTINYLKPVKPKLSNKERSFFGVDIKKAPPMHSWFIFSVGVENCKCLFSGVFYYFVKVYIFCYGI